MVYFNCSIFGRFYYRNGTEVDHDMVKFGPFRWLVLVGSKDPFLNIFLWIKQKVCHSENRDISPSLPCHTCRTWQKWQSLDVKSYLRSKLLIEIKISHIMHPFFCGVWRQFLRYSPSTITLSNVFVLNMHFAWPLIITTAQTNKVTDLVSD